MREPLRLVVFQLVWTCAMPKIHARAHDSKTHELISIYALGTKRFAIPFHRQAFAHVFPMIAIQIVQWYRTHLVSATDGSRCINS